MSLSAFDIFAGPGFLSLGFEREGFKTLLAVEFERNAASTYALNRPRVPVLLQDIRQVDFREAVRAVGRPDVIVGGPPCQGFTSQINPHEHGDVAVAAGAKRALFLQAIRALREVKPAGFLFENVTGLKKRGLHTQLIRALERVGYRVTFEQSVATDFGVPQKRERVFFSGTRGSEVKPPVATTKTPRTVREALAGLPAAMEEPTSDPLHRAPRHSADVKARMAKLKPGESYTAWASHSRLFLDRPAPTMIGGSPRVHPSQARLLTCREIARIQSVPDSYKFSPGELARQICNGVPPPLAAAWARSLKAALSRGGRVQESAINDERAWDEALRVAEVLDDELSKAE